MGMIRAGDIDLYHEIHGEGDPLLLMEGLGYASWMWCKQVDELSRHFQVILFDNRGVGHSDKPPGPYTTAQMADDAAALLDALAIPRCHVLGISMGGMIAQEFALRHPDKVDRLVLGCTTAGGPEAPPPTTEYLQYLAASREMAREDAYREGFRVAAAPGYFAAHPDDLLALLTARLANPQPPEAWLAQAQAVQAHQTWDRLHQIAAPTLVVHGDADVVVPVANLALLASRLPQAETVVYPGAGHLFFIEQAQQFNQLLINWLQR